MVTPKVLDDMEWKKELWILFPFLHFPFKRSHHILKFKIIFSKKKFFQNYREKNKLFHHLLNFRKSFLSEKCNQNISSLSLLNPLSPSSLPSLLATRFGLSRVRLLKELLARPEGMRLRHEPKKYLENVFHGHFLKILVVSLESFWRN